MSELTQKLVPKRFELLREILPGALIFSMLINPTGGRVAARARAEATAAAQAIGAELHFLEAKDRDEIPGAFGEHVALRAKGLLINPDPLFLKERDLILEFAREHRVPVVYFERVFAVSGGLMSYGASVPELFRQAGVYVGRILNGDKPADLPVQQPTKFELVINMKAAKELALTIPATLLASADEVIE
jgi:putative ABC transport system substrate-binding protein